MKVRELIAALSDFDPDDDVEMCDGHGTWAGHRTNDIGSVGYELPDPRFGGHGKVVLDVSMCGL